MATAYQLHIRSTGFNTIHREGRLFQEICVDKYAQIEHERLGYFRTTHFKRRSDRRRGLEDAAANGTDLADVGTRVILPSSFLGGPRQCGKYITMPWQLYDIAVNQISSSP